MLSPCPQAEPVALAISTPLTSLIPTQSEFPICGVGADDCNHSMWAEPQMGLGHMAEQNEFSRVCNYTFGDNDLGFNLSDDELLDLSKDVDMLTQP